MSNLQGAAQSINEGYNTSGRKDRKMRKADDEVVNMHVGALGNGAHSQAIPREMSGWDVYNNEAKKVDTELVNDWRDSLNSLLLFAAIFAAVLTAFIIESKKMLEQDFTGVMVDVMIFYTNSVANGTHNPYSKPEYQVEPSAITVNCLFFASLSTSLVAALASVVALQWVADYDAAITRGGSSPEDRAKRRQFRYAGVVSWKMSEVIAAIPLLLYCSVVLFFGGLILWMWTVHYMVGAVVIGGAVIAGLFYGISTFLAVVFVSAPFRTPLSRWIYSLIHLFVSLLYQLSNSVRAQSISVWLQSWLQIHAIARKREDREVNRRDDMGIKALVWLANQLSISPDSYRQLLLLVGELPKLKREHFLYHGFKDAPWYMIFDLLGWHNLKTGHDADISQDEMYAVSILVQCYKIPQIYEIIRPTESMVYIADDENEQYWSQCCNNAVGQWSPSTHAAAPNSTFLLLRDVPLPSNNHPREVELAIRLSRWRNIGMRIPRPDPAVANRGIDSSSSSLRSPPASPPVLPIGSSLESSLEIIQPFFKEGDLPSWQSKDNGGLYVDVVERLVSLASKDKVHIPPGFLDLLRLKFESIIMGNDAMDNMSCLHMPLRYKEALYSTSLGQSDDLHITFTLLLAKNLKLFTGAEKIRRMKELIIMLWAQHGDPYSEITDETHGLDAFFDAHKLILMKWIDRIYDTRNLHEILHHLAVAQAEEQEFGSLWGIIPPHRDVDPRLVEVLSAFDRFIERGVTPDEHSTLVTLICQDLELSAPEVFEDYFSPNVLDSLRYVRDPCLKFLALFTAGLDTHLVAYNTDITTLRKSWARIATHTLRHHLPKSEYVLRHHASVWPAMVRDENSRSRAVLRNPEALAHLRRLFEYHVPCQEHHDGEAHVLLHIFEHIPTFYVWFDTPTMMDIPVKGRGMNALLVTLMAPKELLQSPEDVLHSHMDRRLLPQVLALLEDARISQFISLALISDMCMLILEGDTLIYPEEIAGIVFCTRQALALPHEHRVVGIAPRLLDRIGIMEAKMHEHGGRSTEERAIAAAEAKMIRHTLLSHVACMRVQGLRSSFALSCAQSREPCSPAVGWLSPFVD